MGGRVPACDAEARLENPLTRSTFFGSLFLEWGLSFASPLVARGGNLTEADLWAVFPEEAAASLGARINAAWAVERTRRPSSAAASPSSRRSSSTRRLASALASWVSAASVTSPSALPSRAAMS